MKSIKQQKVPASRHVFLRTALASALVIAFSPAALADNAIDFRDWDGGVGSTPTLAAGSALNATRDLPKSNYSANPQLAGSAWAHAGGSPWWTFQLTSAADVTVHLAPSAAEAAFKPAFTVWTSGDAKFDGGESAVDHEIATNGWDSPHSFNAVGQLGDFGTYWMSHDPDTGTVYGNMKETLGYANAGAAQAVGGWGESVQHGAFDVSITNDYESGVTGAVGSNWAQLSFTNLQPGWYVVFAGGADHALATTGMNLTVSAVPEPESYAMLLAGLGLLGAMSRRRRSD
ncbi:FxDxF family PEP-CTERM protein [Nitrosovibrio sp. Nv17]|jgi:hypothetical protein|uniref:FxDxF family PEP-CTERM protein n=1 Tax=Nitrosovibrio sp. Nv17 TaxID=1855339 RepID=UPI0009087CAB|nr:FxDxF family PEP-CTERM protein [Nitrosovibrio sp. Nv17]SFW16164.1 PEP-CTERM protein-sorting domain-containing protein/MYXO-CTERM domain-containing protein [Nitrosovibrio sp. Nv17]